MARKNESKSGVTEIGDLRITFLRVPCGPTTIMAQQMQDEKHFTFRKWNPQKLDVPLNEDNDQEFETVCMFCDCCCCECVDKCFQGSFPEIVELV